MYIRTEKIRRACGFMRLNAQGKPKYRPVTVPRDIINDVAAVLDAEPHGVMLIKLPPRQRLRICPDRGRLNVNGDGCSGRQREWLQCTVRGRNVPLERTLDRGTVRWYWPFAVTVITVTS